jgi:hypothetical protein
MWDRKKICVLVNRSFTFAYYPLTVPRDTLLDGELLGNEFIVHDAMCVGGKNVMQENLLLRLDEVRAMSRFIIPIPELKVLVKRMYPMTEIMNINLSKDTDGLIFTPIDEPVRMGTHNTLFKWKPLEKITIDFFVDSDRNLCIQDSIIEKNFTGTDRTNVIVECLLDSQDKQWKVLKIRTDKSHPNNRRTFERTLSNIRENILMSDFICGHS